MTSGICEHGQLTCEHGECRARCEECNNDWWFFGELEDALDRWADDGGRA